MTGDLYYIENTGRPVGNCVRWWRPNGHGYVCDLNEAWKVPLDEALKICHARPKEDIPRLCAYVDALAEKHVDVQRMPRGRRARKR